MILSSEWRHWFPVILRERDTKTKDGGRRLMKNIEIMFVVVLKASLSPSVKAGPLHYLCVWAVWCLPLTEYWLTHVVWGGGERNTLALFLRTMHAGCIYKLLLKCRDQNRLTNLQKHRVLTGNTSLFFAPSPASCAHPLKKIALGLGLAGRSPSSGKRL